MIQQMKYKYCFMALAFFLILMVPLQVAGQENDTTQKIAILPFKVNAQKDLSYLRNGIRDMLASRLAAGGGVKIIDKARAEQAMAGQDTITLARLKDMGARLGADIVVAGSFTSLGGGASLDAKVLMTSTGEISDFFSTAPKEDDVIMAINSLAWDIGEKYLGRIRPASAQPKSQSQQQTAATQSATPSYQSLHPDRAYLAAGGGSAFIRPLGITGPFGFSKSQNFSMAMQAMDVGDIDGDGKDDIVMAAKSKLYVYRMIETRFARIAEIKTNPRYKIHYVSLADLDKDGKDEIYVSANENTLPHSFAVQWNGEKLDYLFKDVRFYVRALEVPGEGLLLAGQKGNMDYEPFFPGIYHMEVKDGEVHAGNKIRVPAKLNLFDFVMADLDSDGRTELVSVDQNDRIRVLRKSGRAMWKSSDYFGGTKRYVGEAENELRADTENSKVERYYIPSRLITVDLNNDKKMDIIVNKNLSSASRLFSNLKSYPNGEIHGLSWNGIGLAELWHTRKIDGYIADYQLKMLDEPGKAVLYVGVILNGMADEVVGASMSTVLMYPLDFAKDEKK